MGLQGQVSPAINYTKDLDLIADRVLSATMVGCVPNWGPTIDRAYQADFANGANLIAIKSLVPGSHGGTLPGIMGY